VSGWCPLPGINCFEHFYDETCIILDNKFLKLIGERGYMATERQKEIKRRRNRRAKIKKYKTRLAQTNDPKERERLIDKLKRIYINPPKDLPAA